MPVVRRTNIGAYTCTWLSYTCPVSIGAYTCPGVAIWFKGKYRVLYMPQDPICAHSGGQIQEPKPALGYPIPAPVIIGAYTCPRITIWFKGKYRVLYQDAICAHNEGQI